ncbi:MAG TPA: efflux RND transporter periplasmic adaptor subunit [Vicinamibacterales bacterium]|nr:efflux RND transporter periplasmic adaptor subunit [Vicinamibacterales bacterium]
MKRVMQLAIVLVTAFSAASCGREAAEPEAELPTLDVTHWTDKTELFMEYPPLVAGQTALYAVHLTRLSDFTAMTAGRPRIEFTPESGGSPVVLQGNEPSRPGVFRVEGASPPAGRYQWALIVDAPGLADRHDLGPVGVFADQAAAVADAEKHAEEDATAISYLKEPQWTNGFGTAQVQEAEVRRAIRVPAVIEPLTGGEAVVSAPADGRFTSASLPSIGTRVSAGQELGRLQPRASEDGSDRASLAATVAEAQAALEGARVELTRSERLLADKAVPARRVEDAQRAVKVAEARLTAAQARLEQRDEALRTGGGVASGNSFVLRAPIAGVVAEVFAALGASFDEGAPLFRIVRTDRVELQAHVPASQLPIGSDIHEIALEIPGRPDPLTVDADHMHFAGIIDPKTRALPVQFDVDNRAGQLLIGQTSTAILYTGRRERMTTVRKDAVLMEAGRAYVFVQTGGESFSRRYIEIATRDGDLVGVRSGVKPGDRVVTRGAYDVQLASAASGLPAEGHVH